jgi:HK97 family phage major capsid protein
MSQLAHVMDNKTILQKADLALSDLTTDGGLLAPAQAKKFMRILINESVIMNQATVVPMKSHKQEINKIRFASRVLRAGQEATALAATDRAKPDLTQTELDAELFKAEIRLNNEVLEDSIEGGTLRQTIMTLMGEAISRDMDEVIIQGDTASADTFLAVLDGILKQATSNVVDHSTTRTNKTLFKNMLKAMPSEFLRTKRAMRFFTSIDSEIDYRDFLADRGTVLGDKFLEQDTPVNWSGIPIIDVPLFPEDLGGGNDSTNTLLVDPKNINVGIWRQIRIETDKLVSEGVLIIVATMRFDVKYAEETAVVKGINVLVA